MSIQAQQGTVCGRPCSPATTTPCPRPAPTALQDPLPRPADAARGGSLAMARRDKGAQGAAGADQHRQAESGAARAPATRHVPARPPYARLARRPQPPQPTGDGGYTGVACSQAAPHANERSRWAAGDELASPRPWTADVCMCAAAADPQGGATTRLRPPRTVAGSARARGQVAAAAELEAARWAFRRTGALVTRSKRERASRLPVHRAAVAPARLGRGGALWGLSVRGRGVGGRVDAGARFAAPLQPGGVVRERGGLIAFCSARARPPFLAARAPCSAHLPGTPRHLPAAQQVRRALPRIPPLA